METALREIGDGAGTQFDPEYAAVFLEHFDELVL
jgi:HD-GYP domain-containing protein (c-di-GMP phosphodiesterase class II)